MTTFNRLSSLLGLLALVCACAYAQIVQIQGSDPISASRSVINSNFSFLDSKQVKGSGVPGAGTCSATNAGTVYLNTTAAEPLSSLYVCANTAPNTYAWELQQLANGVVTTGAYANPSWIVSLDWSKLINLPSFANSQIQINGSNVAPRANLNLISGTGTTLTSTDNPGGNQTNITITSTGGGGGGSGTVNSGTAGQITVYPANGNAVSGVTPSGDATINATTGAISVTKTQGSAFAPSATTDTTNPANIPYTSPANGAGASNLKSIANTFLTPDNFGCHMVADSSTDNSCLGTAINAAATGGNNIRIPAPNNTTSGTTHYYLIRSPLVINLHTHTTSDIVQGLTIECDGDGTTLAYAGADPTQGLFKFVGSIGQGLENVTIKNCTLASSVNAQYVLQFAGVSGPRLDHVNIRAGAGTTVQYGVQYLGSQQGSIISGSNTNNQTGVYLGTLFAPSLGTNTTTLSTPISSADTTIQIASCGSLSGTIPNNVFVIDSEHIRALSCSSGTVTVAATCGVTATSPCRGTEGTQAASHVAGATVTTGTTITSNQIQITGGVQMFCNQNCIYADQIDNTLVDGNYLINNSGNSVFLINGTGSGSVKLWGNQVQAASGIVFDVIGGSADIMGTQGSGSTLLNCISTCYFHDNAQVSGNIIFASTGHGSAYHNNTIVGTSQAQMTLAEPDLISYNNSAPSDVPFSSILQHVMRLDSPVVVTSNYSPPNGDIASFGLNSFAAPGTYGVNVQGSQVGGRYTYLRFNRGYSIGSTVGGDAIILSSDNTNGGALASFSSSVGIVFNRGVQGTTFNGIASTPYSANGVAGVAGVANIGSCQFTFNGILTGGVGSSPVNCGYYQTVYSGATAMTQRPKLQFNGSGVTVSDNGSDTTIVSIAAGGGSGAFSALTTGTNTTATMTVGTGASIVPSGSGVVNANQINGASVPAGAPCIGTNGSGQATSVSCGSGGTANVPSASVSGATATLFSLCLTTPCNASKGSNQIDQISATNTITAPSSGSGTIFIYWTGSGCAIASSGATVTATGSGPCALTSSAGSGFPNDATAIISSIPYTANTWGTPSNYQPTASNPPVIATGTGLSATLSPGQKLVSYDTAQFALGSLIQVPAISSFTDVAWQAGTTATQANGTILFKPVGVASGNGIQSLMLPAPGSAPWSYTVGVAAAFPWTSSFYTFGMVARNSTTNAATTWEVLYSSAGLQPDLGVEHFTVPATGNSTEVSGPFNRNTIVGSSVFLKIQDDGTNLNMYYCLTENDCILQYQETLASYIGTVNQIGIFSNVFADTTTSNGLSVFRFTQGN